MLCAVLFDDDDEACRAVTTHRGGGGDAGGQDDLISRVTDGVNGFALTRPPHNGRMRGGMDVAVAMMMVMLNR